MRREHVPPQIRKKKERRLKTALLGMDVRLVKILLSVNKNIACIKIRFKLLLLLCTSHEEQNNMDV